MNLKALKAKQAELKAQGKAMLDKADAEGRSLNADEEKAFSAIEAELETLAGTIAAAEKTAERRRLMEGTALPTSHPSVQVGDDRSALDPRSGFKSLADFAQAVRAANPQIASHSVDQRLASMYAGPTGYMREGGSNDGYMVPAEFRDRIWALVFEADNLLSEIDAEPTNANQVNDLTDDSTPWGTTGVQAFWRAEAGQMTPTRPNQQPRSVILNELYAFVLASDELLSDAPRLNNRLESKAAEAINWKIDDSITYGDGVAKPLGYMKGGSLVTVAKENAQAADTIVAENVAKMYARLLPAGMARSHWRINSDCLPQIMTLKIGDQPIWTPPSAGFKDAPGGVLLGRPIKLTEHCKTLGDHGDIQLIDPKGYYGLRKESGVQFATSIHLYFDYGLQSFRWTIRFGGQPHLKAAVAPKNGVATKSHFVTLAERA